MKTVGPKSPSPGWAAYPIWPWPSRPAQTEPATSVDVRVGLPGQEQVLERAERAVVVVERIRHGSRRDQRADQNRAGVAAAGREVGGVEQRINRLAGGVRREPRSPTVTGRWCRYVDVAALGAEGSMFPLEAVVWRQRHGLTAVVQELEGADPRLRVVVGGAARARVGLQVRTGPVSLRPLRRRCRVGSQLPKPVACRRQRRPVSWALIFESVTRLEPGATIAPVRQLSSPGDPVTSEDSSQRRPVSRSMKPAAPGPGCNWLPELSVTSGSFGPVGSVPTLLPLMFSPAASARAP